MLFCVFVVFLFRFRFALRINGFVADGLQRFLFWLLFDAQSSYSIVNIIQLLPHLFTQIIHCPEVVLLCLSFWA